MKNKEVKKQNQTEHEEFCADLEHDLAEKAAREKRIYKAWRGARDLDLQLRELDEDNILFPNSGPFILLDAKTNTLVAWKLDLDDVEARLS